jgi:hypothetical protein
MNNTYHRWPIYCDDMDTISLIEAIYDYYTPSFVQIVTDNIHNNIRFSDILFDLFRPMKKCIFAFGTNIYLYYKINNKYYMDMNHLILNLVDSANHANCFHMHSNKICHFIWTTGFNGKIIRRPLIDMKNIGQIILSTNGEFSNLFRQECMVFIIILQILFYCLFFLYILCNRLTSM